MVILRVRSMLLFSAVLVSILSFAGAQEKQIEKSQVKPFSPVSGAQMFKKYCAICHGPAGKGDGPVAAALKRVPPDLTRLAQRHDGKFPDDYVANVLRNGVKNPAHGSGKMPVWGPIFESMDRWKAACPCLDEIPTTVRIANLTDYLKSIQQK